MTLTGKAIVAGVIGDPISHSRSPMLHGFWLDQYGIDGVLVPLQVSSADLTDAVHALPKLGFAGANVTIPHKETVLSLMDKVDTAAQIIGAVNMITVREDGFLYGQNTDGFGFIENLRQQTSWVSKGKNVVVLGAGGAARGVIYALAVDGTKKITIINRTISKAEKLVSDLGPHIEAEINSTDWSELAVHLKTADLLVNTTSLGMAGAPELDVPLDVLSATSTVCDIVYVPLETDLLKRSKTLGLKTCEGLGMLIHQARPAFRSWFGREPDVSQALYDLLKKDIQQRS